MAELAKKLGIPEPAPSVALSDSTSSVISLFLLFSPPEAGLGGIKAMEGRVGIVEAAGIGAGDANVTAAGICMADAGAEKNDGTDAAAAGEAGFGVREKGKADIGGSLAFAVSC